MIRSRPSGLLMRTGRLCSVFSFKHGAVDSYCLSAGVPYALLKRTSGLLQYIVPMCHTVTRSSANRLIVFLRLRWLPFYFFSSVSSLFLLLSRASNSRNQLPSQHSFRQLQIAMNSRRFLTVKILHPICNV